MPYLDSKSKNLTFHPLAALFPVLDGDEAKQLKDDIEVRGLRFPIVLYQGKILDGRNRYNACVALGIEPKTTQYDGDDPEGFVLSANLHRRHLSRKQRGELIAKLLERHPDITSRKLAGEIGVSHVTVEKVRAAVGQLDQQKKRVGADGKKYQPHQRKPSQRKPSTEPTNTIQRNLTDQEAANELTAELGPGKAAWVVRWNMRTNLSRDWARVLEHITRPQTGEGLVFDDAAPTTTPATEPAPPRQQPHQHQQQPFTRWDPVKGQMIR